MRYWMVLLAALASEGALASDPQASLMSPADISCASYLQLPQGQSTELAYWVAGRVVAIAPATFQPSLAKISFRQMQADLKALCQEASDATLFQASAILAFNYQKVPQ